MSCCSSSVDSEDDCVDDYTCHDTWNFPSMYLVLKGRLDGSLAQNSIFVGSFPGDVALRIFSHETMTLRALSIASRANYGWRQAATVVARAEVKARDLDRIKCEASSWKVLGLHNIGMSKETLKKELLRVKEHGIDEERNQNGNDEVEPSSTNSLLVEKRDDMRPLREITSSPRTPQPFVDVEPCGAQPQMMNLRMLGL